MRDNSNSKHEIWPWVQSIWIHTGRWWRLAKVCWLWWNPVAGKVVLGNHHHHKWALKKLDMDSVNGLFRLEKRWTSAPKWCRIKEHTTHSDFQSRLFFPHRTCVLAAIGLKMICGKSYRHHNSVPLRFQCKRKVASRFMLCTRLLCGPGIIDHPVFSPEVVNMTSRSEARFTAEGAAQV